MGLLKIILVNFHFYYTKILVKNCCLLTSPN